MRLRRSAGVLLLLCGFTMTAEAQDRMPPIPADQMTEAQRAAVAAFAEARNAPVTGPFVPLLRSPEVMTRARAMGDYLRFENSLPASLREFVILLTARQWTQQYEWNAHHAIAIQAGLAPQVADAVADGRRPESMSDDEAILYDFCMELFRRQSVSDATYARAVARFGEKGVVDTLGLAGYYTFLAMVLNTARTPLAAGQTPALEPFPR